jgi:phenylpropionate dioxygenase-like ring-hydroxylating dioxygenase large terminal subunit
MLSKDETKLLCETDAGTPMGELFRRFWIPALISEELPEPDCTPVAIKLFGEDLIAFRDTDGKVGLISAFCPHRHAHLFWGRNEECGLRCTYHGWKFDVDGNCVDMPNEPEENRFHDKVKTQSYPTREAGACVWAYMGPKELEPKEIPHLEWARLPDSHVQVTKRLQENNWAQATEGGMDSSHISYLHNMDMENITPSTADKAPFLQTAMKEFGFIEAARRVQPDGKHYWRIRPVMVPSFMMIPSSDKPDRNIGGHVWIPVDDTHCWAYTMTWNATRPLTQEERDRNLEGFGTHCEVDRTATRWDLNISNAWSPIRNLDNNYMIDRSEQKTHSFTGIKGIGEQDCSIQESMGGMSPRWEEHLGTSDRAIILFRKMVMGLARDLMEGSEPELAHAPEKFKVRSTGFTIDPEQDWVAEAEKHMVSTV